MRVKPGYPASHVIRAQEWLALAVILAIVLGVPIVIIIEAIRRWA